MNRTLAQRRAAHALRCVNNLRWSPEWSDAERDRYAGYVERLPAMILINGLGQAAATELAAGREQKEHRQLYCDLQDWLCGKDGPYPDAAELVQAIVSHDLGTYLRAQAEALAWLEWLKKFAAAYLKQLDAAGRGAAL